MSPERWQQIEEIFQNALDLPASKREGYVSEKCAEDADLKAEVEKLLSQFDDASSFIETPAYNDSQAGVLSKLIDLADDDPMIGNILGSYRIELEIGRGGMGAVYEAVRADGEFRRKAAIKIVKRGMDTDFILRRFRNERQILATLEHPYITRLLDGGTTDDGRPYFVMDYIEGLPLYRYSDKKRLAIDERLKLFTKICEAVEYAHQNLVIHRDLKPSNILVSADGTPRLLDFGIAKLLNPEMASDTLQPTATAMRMMTIDYASPEQVNGEKVTFATDIYSLGVILFELLTGHRPYRFINRTPHEMARVICEESPMLPSDAITRSEETLPIIHVDQEALTIRHLADLRKNSPDKLRELLRGNLDNITLKALCKLSDERYNSVKRFREDIEKHLEGKPVSTPFYFPIDKVQTTQNNANTKLIAVLPLKLLNFSATENTDENYLSIGLADAIISRLTSVRDFTVRPTSSISCYEKSEIDPLQAGRELGVDFVLDGRIKKYGQKLRVSLQMLDVRQGATTWAGQFDEKFSDVLALEDAISEQVAEALVSQNTGENLVKLGKRGTDNAQAYEAYLRGRFFWNQFNPATFPKALESFERAVELDPNYAVAYAGIADYYNWATIFGLYSPSEGYQKTRAAAEKALEIDNQLSEAISILGFITAFADFNWTEAERLFKQSLEHNPNYGLTHEWYSALLAGTGRNDEAYREITRSLELDPLSLRTVTLTAWTLYQLRRYPEALTKIDEIFEMSPGYYQGYFQSGNILSEIGRAEEAVAAGRKGMEIAPGLGYMNYKLCFALTSLNRFDEAWEVLRNFEKASPTPEMNSFHFGMCYAALGERDLAFKWLDKAVEDRHPWCVWLATEPKLDRLRNDERFDELLRKTNRQHLIAKNVEDAKQSIAVLPLQFIGEVETGDDYLSVGLADAMITRLSQVRRLVVRPTNSVLRFAETQDSFAAGRELGVDCVLSGMIRPAGKRIRISAQLLDVKANTTLWSEKFDEEFTEVLELEDLVAEKVAKLLIPKLTGEEQQRLEKRGTNNVEAYQAYLKGRFHWNQFTTDSLPKAIEQFQKAVELDPHYALAYVGIADFYNWANVYGMIPSVEANKFAEKSARKALEIDDQLGEVYSSLSFIEANHFNWEKSLQLAEKALELNPNYQHTHQSLAAIYVVSGRSDEGLKEMARAEELDPLSLRIKAITAWKTYQSGKFTEALAKTNEIIALDDNFPQGHLQKGSILTEIGNPNEAVAEIEKGLKLMPDSAMAKYHYCFALAAANRREYARKVWLEMKDSSTYISPAFLAYASVAVGEIDEAFAYLNKAADEFSSHLHWLGTDAKLAPIRQDKRYLELMRRTKNPLLKQFEEKFSSEEKHSIAVLPLQFIGEAQTADAYLSVGLADAMITRLSQVRRLVVRPTNSVLRFAETQDSFAAGRELGVDYVLTGMIRPAGKRIRISAQLLDVKANTTLWSEKFDEEFTEVLELEDKVAEKVAKLLIPQLTTEEEQNLAKRKVKNVEAYEAYLRGKYHLFNFTPDDFVKAVAYFEKAIEFDPNYALAYSALSDVYFTLAGFASNSPAESFPLIEKFAQKAIELDDRLGEAYANLGMVKSYNVDLETGEKLLKRGLELSPNQLNGYVWHSVFLTLRGKSEEAIVQARKAYELDPTAGFHQYHYIWVLYHNRRFDEAVSLIRKGDESAPNFAHGQAVGGWIFRHLNNANEAIKYSEKAHQLSPKTGWIMANLAATYAKFGEKEKAISLLQKLEAEKNQYVSPYCLAQAYLHLGNKEKTFEMLEKSFADKDVWYPWISSDAELDSLRNEPRFINLIQQIKPLSKAEEAIHQSQIPTKTFAAEALKDKEDAEIEISKPSFFYRHRYKFIFGGVLLVLILIGYAVGIVEVKVGNN